MNLILIKVIYLNLYIMKLQLTLLGSFSEFLYQGQLENNYVVCRTFQLWLSYFQQVVGAELGTSYNRLKWGTTNKFKNLLALQMLFVKHHKQHNSLLLVFHLCQIRSFYFVKGNRTSIKTLSFLTISGIQFEISSLNLHSVSTEQLSKVHTIMYYRVIMHGQIILINI